MYVQRISGLTIPQWCERNQFSPNAYHYWRNIVRTQKVNQSDSLITTYAKIKQMMPMLRVLVAKQKEEIEQKTKRLKNKISV